MSTFNPRDPGQVSNDTNPHYLGSLGFFPPATNFNFYRFDEFGPYGENQLDDKDMYSFTPVNLSVVRMGIHPIGYTQGLTNYQGVMTIAIYSGNYKRSIAFAWDGGLFDGALATSLGLTDEYHHENFDNYEWKVPVTQGSDIQITVSGALINFTASGTFEKRSFTYRIDIVPDTGSNAPPSVPPDAGKLGTAANDTISFQTLSEKTYDGSDGIDSISFATQTGQWNKRSSYHIEFKDGVILLDSSHRFANVERLTFSDINLAFDLDGNAGKVARLLGAIFGAEAVDNSLFVGIGLDALDGGMSLVELAGLALQAAGLNTNQQIVATLWENIVGSPATFGDIAPFLTLLDGGMSAGQLAVEASNTDLNAINIDLVGLQSSGLEYWM